MAKKKALELVREWMEAFGAENGYELSRSEFIKEGGDWYLRVYVDKLIDGKYDVMGTEDCEKISRFLSAKLDEEDPIEQNYVLEVSSPGMDHPLISPKDFERFKGEMIEVSLYEPIDGNKFYTGQLLDSTEETVTIKVDNDKEISLPKNKAGKINLAVIF